MMISLSTMHESYDNIELSVKCLICSLFWMGSLSKKKKLLKKVIVKNKNNLGSHVEFIEGFV